MKLSREFVRYLLVGQAIIPFFINIVVNLVIGWVTFGRQNVVSTWAIEKGAAADSIGTCFFLPLITCLIATPIVRAQVRNGTAPRIADGEVPRWTRMLSDRVLLRSLSFGIIGMLLFAMPVYFGYVLFAGTAIETTQYIIWKSIAAGVFGVVMTPIIAFAALCEQLGTSRNSAA